IGAFAALVAYPWQATAEEEEPRERVFGTLLLTLIAGGAGLSILALVQQVAGNGQVLWLTNEEVSPNRASGPFVNPNHLAAWLEMVLPVSVAYFGALATRLGRRIANMASTSVGMGVRARRAWASALAAHQRRLWLPLVLAAAVMLMFVAHLATG